MTSRSYERPTLDRQIHVLLIAPCAPPKNSPESLQVARLLDALDPSARITLVTTPANGGWEREDESLRPRAHGLRVIRLRMPWHKITQRVISNHRLSGLHVPDADFWLIRLARLVRSQLDSRPDVIYSRSAPFSAALLARRLKHLMGLPWVMHLSDPWSESPYRQLSRWQACLDRRMEAACFQDADLITLTTSGQAAHYKRAYPQRERAIVVTPNMMPAPSPSSCSLALQSTSGSTKMFDPSKVNFVLTGALYGNRSPIGLLRALSKLRVRAPAVAHRLNFHFFGNMYADFAAMIDAAVECRRYGAVSSDVAHAAQREADILFSIEPAGDAQLLKDVLLSKVVDYLSQRKPIFALTPRGSVTEDWCARGFGWAFEPTEDDAIVDFLVQFDGGSRDPLNVIGEPPEPPPELCAIDVASDVLAQLREVAFCASADHQNGVKTSLSEDAR